MKAMRGRIGLQKHCARKLSKAGPDFAKALGARTRPRVAFVRARARAWL